MVCVKFSTCKTSRCNLFLAADVVKAIEEAVDMETLTLSGNTCGVEACKAIGAALSTKPTFKVNLKNTLVITYCPLT